jgi:hypothetical protein
MEAVVAKLILLVLAGFLAHVPLVVYRAPEVTEVLVPTGWEPVVHCSKFAVPKCFQGYERVTGYRLESKP